LDIDLTSHELGILIFLVRNRLRNESKRKRRLNINGLDVQNLKVRQLADLLEKLQAIQTEA
jgi:hypothetical protein